MENDILRMQLQAFAAGYLDFDGNGGLMVPSSDMDRIEPYGNTPPFDGCR